MQTTFVTTPDGRKVQIDMIGCEPFNRALAIQVVEPRKRPKEKRPDVLMEIFPAGTKIDLEKNRQVFSTGGEQPKKKIARAIMKSIPHDKISIPIFPPRAPSVPKRINANRDHVREFGRKSVRTAQQKPITKRACMTCAALFHSEGAHHRMCKHCRQLRD